LNVEVRIVHGIILVRATGDLTERTWVEDLAASESGPENLTISPAAIDAAGTEAAHGDYVLGTIKGQCCIIGIGSAQVHVF
jgi:hypothetical protein